MSRNNANNREGDTKRDHDPRDVTKMAASSSLTRGASHNRPWAVDQTAETDGHQSFDPSRYVNRNVAGRSQAVDSNGITFVEDTDDLVQFTPQMQDQQRRNSSILPRHKETDASSYLLARRAVQSSETRTSGASSATSSAGIPLTSSASRPPNVTSLNGLAKHPDSADSADGGESSYQRYLAQRRRQLSAPQPLDPSLRRQQPGPARSSTNHANDSLELLGSLSDLNLEGQNSRRLGFAAPASSQQLSSKSQSGPQEQKLHTGHQSDSSSMMHYSEENLRKRLAEMTQPRPESFDVGKNHPKQVSSNLGHRRNSSNSAKMAMEVCGSNDKSDAVRDMRSRRLARELEQRSGRNLTDDVGYGSLTNNSSNFGSSNNRPSPDNVVGQNIGSRLTHISSSSQTNIDVEKYLQTREKKDAASNNSSLMSLTDNQLFRESHNEDVERYLQSTSVKQRARTEAESNHRGSIKGESDSLRASSKFKPSSSMSSNLCSTELDEDLDAAPRAFRSRVAKASVRSKSSDDITIVAEQPRSVSSTIASISKAYGEILGKNNLAPQGRLQQTVSPESRPSPTVNQYLASRNVRIANEGHTPQVGTSYAGNAIYGQENKALLVSDSSGESDEEESVIDLTDVSSVGSDASNDADVTLTDWSVRICIVSAVDFPGNVVPNLPFSPLLKVGLVPFPTKDSVVEPMELSDNDISTAEASCRKISSTVERSGLSSINKSRLRCTSTKILSKRDNGSVEYHEEMRWDRVKNPEKTALVLELCSRSVMTPANIKESPPPQFRQNIALTLQSTGRGSGSPVPGASSRRHHTSQNTETPSSGLGSLFRRPNLRKADSAEMEEANAAAAVAKLLVQGGSDRPRLMESKTLGAKGNVSTSQQSNEIDVKLRPRKKKSLQKLKMTNDLRLGSTVVPLTCLALNKAMADQGESARIEQWFELKQNLATSDASSPTSPSRASSQATGRNPSVLLEITFTSSERLNDSEDEMDDDEDASPTKEITASFSKRASQKIRKQLKQETSTTVEVPAKVLVEPSLEPGIIDYAFVVGARDIGDQKDDDGAKGWVNSSPEFCILEQFPPNDEFHLKNGRKAILPNKVEWFCFPDGCRLWRGLTPPNYDELRLKRFSASSPSQIATSFASFDACLGCTTCFSWFVMATNSEDYGSEMVKTYGAIIRFYVPAPTGIDPKQDDYAQTLMMSHSGHKPDATKTISNVGIGVGDEKKRLWVPIGICLTSNLPIIGTMEVMLLRLCESLAATKISTPTKSIQLKAIHDHLVSVVVLSQKPVRGVVNCSVPFLSGERLLITLPPRSGLPPLPHGNAVASVCRLLGADGINFLLAAFLTECKILLHSDDVANLCLVAEVMTALIYPFYWALPYIPVLPTGMMEILEAPLSFLLGIPSCNMKFVDPMILEEDFVVVDLDRDFSTTEYIDARGARKKRKTPTPLPASVASNISKAVYRLIKAEEEHEEAMEETALPGARSFPRLEQESQREREFRVTLALEICGLIRGYEECVVFSSTQPVFNVDKFLKIAPAMYEEQRGTSQNSSGVPRQVISPRSRRFLSLLVSCQHFHQFLESLQNESIGFFHLLMNALTTKGAMVQGTMPGHILSIESDRSMDNLCLTLQRMEDKISTFDVATYAKGVIDDEVIDHSVASGEFLFPRDLLQQIVSSNKTGEESSTTESEGVKHISVEFLLELEKNPWKYQTLFGVQLDSSCMSMIKKVSLVEALGERRYRAWKLSGGNEKLETDRFSLASQESKRQLSVSLDLKSLLTSVAAELSSVSPEAYSGSTTPDDTFDSQATSSERKIDDARDRDILRRCLEYGAVGSSKSNKVGHNGDPARDIIAEAELALRNPAARQFLMTVLSKRNRSDSNDSSGVSPNRRGHRSGAIRLESKAFEILVRLEWAMLDALLREKEYSQAYSLLRFSAGLFTSVDEMESDVLSMTFITSRISLHPIFANLGLWEKVKDMHAKARCESQALEKVRGEGSENYGVDDDYEATVATLYDMLGYGIPAEELARFATRISDQKGWFRSERGQSLLLLARRLCVRRDQGNSNVTPIKKSDIDIIRTPFKSLKPQNLFEHVSDDATVRKVGKEDDSESWLEVGWCHPAAQSTRKSMHPTPDAPMRSTSSELLGSFEPKVTGDVGKYMKRSAITSMAYLGLSVVVTGGLDGGVFMARRVSQSDDTAESSNSNALQNSGSVRGVHLDWGSSGSRHSVGTSSTSMDGEFGVGAVTCLTATHGNSQSIATTSRKDVCSPSDEDILEAMDGCRVVAGTSCGDLRVWTVKDVFSAVFFAQSGRELPSPVTEGRFANQRRAVADYASGSSLTRLKFSLRGRALSGHRGGVSCIDVHSNMYKPDSIVSGGADGLIKVWSLKAPTSTPGTRRKSTDNHNQPSSTNAARGGDALSILSGHGGRILCVKTAWHGDRLLSGGADRTVRLWDVAGSGGKCLNSMSGHFGWVTFVQYWGPNTIVSASTDRSVALWDSRVGNSPLFTLRHHYAPVSDLLVGPRTDPIIISAASDGTVAAWDLRLLGGGDASGSAPPSATTTPSRCKAVRSAAAKLYLHDFSRSKHVCGPIKIAKGFSRDSKSVLCVGSDAVVREWDVDRGAIVSEHSSGHCDNVSTLVSLQNDKNSGLRFEADDAESSIASITTSWDGTVRMRTKQRL